MPAASRLSYAIGPILIVALGAVSLASAQSASPFASKKKKQAWETAPAAQPAPAPAQSQAPQTYQPQQPSYQSPSYTAPSYTAPSYQAPAAPAATPYSYQPPATTSQSFTGGTPEMAGEAPSGAYYPGRVSNGQAPASSYGSQPYGGQQYGQPAPQQPNYGQPAYQQTAQAPAQGYGQPAAKRSWKDKLGLGRLETMFKGGGSVGAAATKTDDWREDFVADGFAEFEVSAITQGGLEYGVNLGARGQYDKYRRGFGQRLRDCPPANPNCASALVAGVPTALRGHTSQFYSNGADNAKEFEVQLESAYVFLRSAYGDVTVGRDDGAAYLFSLGAPTLLSVGASNSPVDYTGLDSVKTVNDASGFSEKITYTSPRLLGDQIGFGVQIGASYAPNARACGVDYCVRRDEVAGVISPDLKDILEFGVSLDRTFDNGLKVEGTATYARGSEQRGLAAFDDLSAINAGVEVSLEDWTLGGSWLKSNNGLADGDYEAWDAGLTWKPSQLGFTLGYGQAKDDNVQLKSRQAMFGVSYEFDKYTLGTGVQYFERKTPLLTGGMLDIDKETGTAIFVEGGFKF